MSSPQERVLGTCVRPAGSGGARTDLAVGVNAGEYAGVGVIKGGKALCDQPHEEHALEAAPSLLDAMYRFFDAGDERF